MRILIAPYSKNLRNGNKNPKNWDKFPELIKRLQSKGHEIVQIVYGDEPQLLCEHIVNPIFESLVEELHKCDLFISIDTYLQHAAHYIGKRGIAIFTVSDPSMFGYEDNVNLFVSKEKFRPNQLDVWENSEYDPTAFVSVNVVMTAFEHHWEKSAKTESGDVTRKHKSIFNSV